MENNDESRDEGPQNIAVIGGGVTLIELAKEYLPENRITYVFSNAEEKYVLEYKFQELNFETLETFMAGKSFDLIIGNPPYGGKDKKIIKKCIEKFPDALCIFLNPARWLQDPLLEAKNKEKQLDFLKGYVKNIEIIPEQDMARLFGDSAGRFDGEIITLKKGSHYDFKKLSKNSIVSKVLKKPHSLKDGDTNFVPVSKIINRKRGKGSRFFLTQGSYYKTKDEAIRELLSKGNNATGHVSGFSFGTFEEAKNCWNYMQLKSFRAMCSIIFKDTNIYFQYLPMANDFSKSWTDEMLFNWFELDGQERKQLAELSETLGNN